MTTFFIGCTHFGHDRIIKLANRPFADVQEMDMTMVDRWNKVVKPDDTVWHLGDFAWKNDDGYFSWLNGHKCLVIGNHDHAETLELPWKRITFSLVEEFQGVPIHLNRYPLEEWQGYFKRAIHLHSHTHGTRADIPGRMDVGVERIGYQPISLDEILAHPEMQEWRKAT